MIVKRLGGGGLQLPHDSEIPMASILDKPAVRDAVLPIRVEQYHRLGEEGIIPEQTELLRGVIVERMVKSPLHTYIVQLFVRWLEAAVDVGHYVRKEEPLTLSDSEPEPDVAVVPGVPEDYRQSHPTSAEFVIEVAIATVALDREKADIYAAEGVSEYWIVVPDERMVETYREPTPNGYRFHEQLTDPDIVLCPKLLPQAVIRLADVFRT